jgi:hypothetical protein
VDEDDEPPFRRDWEPHRGGLILTLGVLSICLSATCIFTPLSLPLGIAAWVMGQGDLGKIRGNVLDPEGETNTRAGLVCGIIGTVLSALMLVSCGLSAVA